MGGCCSSEDELPSISRSDSLVQEFGDGSHISRNTLDELLLSLNEEPNEKARLDILRSFTEHRFALSDFDAILACFESPGSKLAASRILQKCLVGSEVNSGLLLRHFGQNEQYT